MAAKDIAQRLWKEARKEHSRDGGEFADHLTDVVLTYIHGLTRVKLYETLGSKEGVSAIEKAFDEHKADLTNGESLMREAVMNLVMDNLPLQLSHPDLHHTK